jgi:hypothetical protein
MPVLLKTSARKRKEGRKERRKAGRKEGRKKERVIQI